MLNLLNNLSKVTKLTASSEMFSNCNTMTCFLYIFTNKYSRSSLSFLCWFLKNFYNLFFIITSKIMIPLLFVKSEKKVLVLLYCKHTVKYMFEDTTSKIQDRIAMQNVCPKQQFFAMPLDKDLTMVLTTLDCLLLSYTTLFLKYWQEYKLSRVIK